MNEIIKDLVANLINPQAKEKRQLDLKHELQTKFNKSLHLKEYLKSWAWLEYERPKIYGELEAGVRRLLQDGMTMDEAGIKTVLSYMKALKDKIDRMRWDIEEGEKAGQKLEQLK